MSAQIVPNLWLDHKADEAARFYQKAFGAVIKSRSHYPLEGLPEFQREFAGQTLTIELEIMGTRLVLLNAGNEFTPTPANSFLVIFNTSFDPQAETHMNEVWEQLLEGGRILVENREYQFAHRYGWIEDKFGFSWQLLLDGTTEKLPPSIVPSLLFRKTQNSTAEQALAFYLKTFIPSSLDNSGMNIEGIKFSEYATSTVKLVANISLAENCFSLMETKEKEEFEFSEAVSYELRVKDQEEIDYYWHLLSSVPESAVCGWAKDRFGVSWQIVPENMGELMERPGAWQRLLGMSKIIIADF